MFLKRLSFLLLLPRYMAVPIARRSTCFVRISLLNFRSMPIYPSTRLLSVFFSVQLATHLESALLQKLMIYVGHMGWYHLKEC